MFAGNYAPDGWLFCEGQLLAISEYQPLFNVIGTAYGGDGAQTFALPDLRGRLPVHQGNGFMLGEKGGVEEVTLTVDHIPAHTHALQASTSPGVSSNAEGNVLASSRSTLLYLEGQAPDTNLNAAAVGPAGGGVSHSNVQPYLCVSFIIALLGLVPPPS
jgi:microcystin-dependent protein